MKSYDEYTQQWNNRQVTKFGGQCVAGISEFEAENDLPIVWGDAVAWINNPIMLSAYDWIWNDPNNGNQLPGRGDIVIWDGNTPYTEGSGHIAFFDQPINSKVFMSFGQNSGGATMHFAQVHWAHVAGWYHLKPQPELSHLPYTKRTITPKRIVFNKDTHLYNLSLQTIEDIVRPDKWVGSVTLNRNAPVWVDGIIDHQSGHSYYTHEEPFGYATEDCDDYVEPVPVPPALPPAAPIDFKKAEEYTILPPAIVYFGSAQDAVIDRNALGQLDKGTYKVVSRDRDMVNLSTNYPNNENKWINPSMNVLPTPEPAIEVVPPAPVEITQPVTNKENDMATDWKQCTPLKVNPHTGQWLPVKYRSTNDMVTCIRSLDGKQPATLPLPPHHELMIVSTFRGPDGELYARDDLLTASHRYYALRFDMLEKVVPPPIVRNLDTNHDGDVNISDFIDFGNRYFRPGIDVVARTAKVITGPKARKFVDGFSKAIKKEKVQ